METKIIKPRLRTMGRVALAGAVGMGLALVSGASASAAPATTANRCIITHELYQQLGTINADADGELCGEYGTQVELDVYRNGVLVAAISGGIAPYYRYDCATTEPTVWSTNWDPPQTFSCG
jgi:hypothetical protein